MKSHHHYNYWSDNPPPNHVESTGESVDREGEGEEGRDLGTEVVRS